MEKYRIRRLMVQNDKGVYTGILSLADIVHHGKTQQIGAELLDEISMPVRYP
jgi:hypothetical protein